jgi:hypothetical protein
VHLDTLVFSDGVHDVGDLHGQLTSWGHDEGLAVVRACLN